MDMKHQNHNPGLFAWQAATSMYIEEANHGLKADHAFQSSHIGVMRVELRD